MRYAHLLIGSVAILLLPFVAQSKWGPGGCFLPAQTPAVADDVLSWVPVKDRLEQVALYKGRTQIGIYHYLKRAYWPIVGNAWGAEAEPPIAPPPPPPDLCLCEIGGPCTCDAKSCGCPECRVKEAKKAAIEEAEREYGKLEAWQLAGVAMDKISCHKTRHSINGDDVTEPVAFEALGDRKGPLGDDSSKLFLSVRGTDASKIKRVLDDIAADSDLTKWVSERCHLWTGTDTYPCNVDRDGKKLCAVGDVTISLQLPDGQELWHDTGYTQGAPSLGDLRKADPTYDPGKSPGPARPKPGPAAPDLSGMLPWGAVFAAIAACVAIILIPRRPNNNA